MLFSSLNLKKWILDVLNSMNFKTTTEIQTKSFLRENSNRSQIITSKTGSGKTFCYVLPILNNLNLDENKVQAIIVLPTKELSQQIFSLFYKFTAFSKLKVKILRKNENILKNQPHILIGTPYKIYNAVKLNIFNKSIKYFVLDEADMLLDFGFYDTIYQIFKKINSTHLIKYATSATLHTSLANHLRNILGNAKVINNSSSIWLNENLCHNIVYQSVNSDPINTLFKLLKIINPYFCIIFTNTKNEANLIYKLMIQQEFNVSLLHQDLFERKRRREFKKITKNEYQYIVVTDLMARGVDLPLADVVISYGLPNDTMFYIHRAGRVGRNKKNGNCYLIYRNNQDNLINNLIRKGIKWNFQLIRDDELINREKKLHFRKKILLDQSINASIKRIYVQGIKKVKPCYKKKIKLKINKIKQKQRHLFIEKKIKQNLLLKNIKNSKCDKNKIT